MPKLYSFKLISFIVTIVYIAPPVDMQRLAPFMYEAFPTGSIIATGWLHDQLSLCASGLGGNLFTFYRYVARSTWLGGTEEYSELHESAPYWFNYIVPLAWTLNDARLKTQANQFLDYVLDHQAADGWLGPETTRQTRGIWARSLLCFGLTQYAEANPSEAERVVDAMHRFFTLVHSMLQNNYTGLLENKTLGDDFDPYGFGLSRTHELPISLMWLYENYPRNNSQVLWETMELMFQGGRIGGRDWTKFFIDGVFPTLGTPNITTSGFTHGVNLVEGLRYPTVLYRMTANESLVQQTYNAVAMTAEYQTSLSGTIIADEHLGGLSPERGSETCMSVESMFSYAYLYRFYGANDFGDRVERAGYNAFPAAISGDWWSHQYVSQTNQPWSRNLTGQPYFNVVPYGNTFGLEPNFPCCTVNHPQAYPKFVASSYVRNGNNSIIHMLLGPTGVKTTIADQSVSVVCTTNYPFSGTLRYSIMSSIQFDFALRVPEWANSSLESSTSAVDAGTNSQLTPDSSSLQHYNIRPGKTTITVTIPMRLRVEYRNGHAAVFRGPLLYALDMPYNSSFHQPLNWTDRLPLPVSETVPQSKDWVLNPTMPWKFAIDPDITKMTVENIRSEEADLPSQVWTRDGPPTAIWVDGYPIDWPENKGTAAVPPENPVVNATTKTRLRLIPYGAAKLHIAEFPVAKIVS